MALEVMGTKIALKIPDLALPVVAESIHGESANVPTKIHSTLRKKQGSYIFPIKSWASIIAKKDQNNRAFAC